MFALEKIVSALEVVDINDAQWRFTSNFLYEICREFRCDVDYLKYTLDATVLASSKPEIQSIWEELKAMFGFHSLLK